MKIIGISGISGSGKSRLTRAIKDAFGDSMEIIHQDNYYRDQSDISFEERVKTNYDEPQSIEFDLMFKDVVNITKGNAIDIPIYDFSQHTRSEQTEKKQPKPFLLVEGTMIYAYPELKNHIDLKIYVDTPMDIAIVRRITRDIEERSRRASEIQDQYFKTVRKGMYQYTISQKDQADLIISGEKDVLDHLDFISTIIKMKKN